MPKDCKPTDFASPWSRWFFAACILFVLYLSYRLIAPFLVPVFLAVVLVVVSAPLYNFFQRVTGKRPWLASALTCLLLTIIIALPFFFIASVITSQALDLYTTVSNLLQGDQLAKSFQAGLGRFTPYLERLQDALGLSHADVLKQVGEIVRKVSNLLYENLAGLLKGFTNLIIGFALVLFVTFYLLMDGGDLVEKLASLSPLPQQTNERIKKDILDSLRATLKGSVVLALIQGVAGGLGFGVFGVPNALFWGTVMVFASVVPIVGTALVWVPAGIYLIVLGETGKALGVMAWCLTAGLVCDNLLRPRLIGGQANLHPLLTFFSVLGGLSLFGIVGLILGPLILAVLLSLLEVYQRYFLNPPADETEPGGPPAEA